MIHRRKGKRLVLYCVPLGSGIAVSIVKNKLYFQPSLPEKVIISFLFLYLSVLLETNCLQQEIQKIIIFTYFP